MEVATAFTLMKVLVGAGGGGMIAAQAISVYRNRGKVQPLATARIKNNKELKDITADEGVVISSSITISEKFSNEAILIFGPTGSGKTTGFFIPNLLRNDIKGSIIVLDPKGEQYKLSASYQKTVCNRKVIRFAPLNPELSARYNLLENCKDTSEVLQLASTLLYNGALSLEIATGRQGGSTDWITMAEPLLACALLYVKALGKPFNTVEYALKLITDITEEELFYLIEYSNNEDAKTQFNIFKTVLGASNTSAGIKITLTSNTKLFTDKKINTVNSYSDFNFENLRKEKTIVYITYPEHKSLYVAPYMACFFTQMLNTLIEGYKEGISLPISMFFDEFANIGMISNMSGYASTVRSREINLNVCLQSITQLEQIYGEKSAQAIINNLKTKIFLPGLSDLKTLNYATDLCGSKEIKVLSYSVNPQNEVTNSYSFTTRNVLNPDEVRTLENGSLLIIASNKQPVLSVQNSYYLSKEYVERIRETKDLVIRKMKDNKAEVKEFLEMIMQEVAANYNLCQEEKKAKGTAKETSLGDELFPDDIDILKEIEEMKEGKGPKEKKKRRSLVEDIFGNGRK